MAATAVAPPVAPHPAQSHLTLQTLPIGADTLAIRSQDWDRDRFDIEFALENGTTYNSFLIRGEKVALIDTSHEKFRQLYLDLLQGILNPAEIDYLVVSHTEPDHSGLVRDLLDLAPHLTIVASKVAVQFLEDLVHRPFERLVVKNGDRLDLGKGHVLEFVSAPNLHWPDTILTYDHGTQILYTCDVFGMHYCDDFAWDEHPHLLQSDYKLYYDCLMGPNARSVLSALKRMEALPPIAAIATGHGPLLRYHLTDWVEHYRTWSLEQAKAERMVAVFYLSGYGQAEALAQAIAHGIQKTGVQAELVDLRLVDAHEVRELMSLAMGVVVGMPPQTGPDAAAAQVLLKTLLAATHSKQSFGLFESGGEDDESVYLCRNTLQEIGAKEAFAPILLKQPANEALLQLAEEAGTDLGQWLIRDRSIQQMKALDADLDRALGRISNGLYIITAQKGHANSAMLASWVAQASSEPPGITIAVAKDRAIESFMQVGDTFVLNVLQEGNYQPLMRHFLRRFPPGADRFAGIKTYPAANGSPILADALAYLECRVVSRMETSDHWVVYSTLEAGRVSNLESLTAIHHRKVGNHY